jgi:hypothetical protein
MNLRQIREYFEALWAMRPKAAGAVSEGVPSPTMDADECRTSARRRSNWLNQRDEAMEAPTGGTVFLYLGGSVASSVGQKLLVGASHNPNRHFVDRIVSVSQAVPLGTLGLGTAGKIRGAGA